MLASIAQRGDVGSELAAPPGGSAAWSGLRVCARDPEDGTVEAIELPARRYVLAVQWHPENQAPEDPEQRKLFQSFAAAL